MRAICLPLPRLEVQRQAGAAEGALNYLCLERLEQQSMAGGELAGQTLIDLVQLRKWSSQTKEGDISTCSEVAEDSFVWPLVTSTNDNCRAATARCIRIASWSRRVAARWMRMWWW